MKNKAILHILGIPLLILMVPFTAMQFDSGINWDVTDFIVAGSLLVIAMTFLKLAIKMPNKYRIVALALIILLVIWVYLELAVGLFTNWGS